MSRTLQFKRYPRTTLNNITGAPGEIIVDTTTDTLTVHDGTTAGGHRLATESFAISNGGSGSNYGNSNVAIYLTQYAGSVNASQVIYNTDYLNLGSKVGFQLQYDPTGTYNAYDIKNGSWIFFDSGGLVWSSNVSGNWDGTYNTNTVVLGNDGGVTATGNITAPNIYTNLLNTNHIIGKGIVGNGQNITIDPDNANQSYIRIDGDDGGGERVVISNQLPSSSGIYFYSKGGNVFRMYDNQFMFPDNTWQSTAFTGYAIDDTARNTANAAFTKANTSITVAPRYINLTNSSMYLDGATSNVWSGTFSSGLKNTWAGFYNQNNSTALVTLASAGANVMSMQMDGSLFVGEGFVSDALGVVPSYGGWIVAASGIKSVYNIYAGADLQSGGNVITGGYFQFADGTRQYTANVPDSYARNTANAAFTKANTVPSALANTSYTALLNSVGQFVLPSISSGGYTGGSLVSTDSFIFNAAGNLWVLDTVGNFISPYNVKITPGGIQWPDNTYQNTAASSVAYTQIVYSTANLAYSQANASFGVANGAASFANGSFTLANTNNTLATNAGNFANGAFTAANNAASIIAQNAQSNTYTLVLTDAGKHIYSTNTSTQIINIPNNGTVSWPVGSTIMLVLKGTGTMNVIPATGISMYLANNSTAKTYANVYSYGMATLLNVAANTWFINGAGVS